MKSLARATNFLLELLAGAPATPTEGQMYYNSTTKAPMYHNGTTFVSMGGSSSGMTDDELGMMNSMGGMY